MVINPKHADDAGLDVLLFGDEDSDQYRATAAHVESCVSCRQRLDAIAGSTQIDDEARALLSDYPWDDLKRSRIDQSAIAGDNRVSLTFLSPPTHPEMLGRLGRYEIERVVGSGGMGIVLKAFDTELNRPVAIKVLAQHLAYRGAARQRFAREAKAAAAVVHEHVVAIHNVEAERDLPFLVMQYVAGESLQARVDREGPLEAKEILRIGIQCASGLAAAHEQGVVHRDVKPGNILLENGVERVLLTDFGLARTVDDASLTHSGVVAGTPQYMSPEQADGAPTDHRTDLFSLGSVLYFMATGHPPFRAERAMGVLHRICRDRQRRAADVNAEIPDDLSRLIDWLLEKKPSRRPATALQVKETLARTLASLQQRGWRPRRFSRRVPRLAITAAAVCGLAAISTAIAMTVFWSAPETSAGSVQPASVGARNSTSDTKPINEATRPSRSTTQSVAIEDLTEADHGESSELRSLAERLRDLESMSQSSSFARPPADGFHRQVEAYDQLLNSLDGDVFPGTSASER